MWVGGEMGGFLLQHSRCDCRIGSGEHWVNRKSSEHNPSGFLWFSRICLLDLLAGIQQGLGEGRLGRDGLQEPQEKWAAGSEGYSCCSVAALGTRLRDWSWGTECQRSFEARLNPESSELCKCVHLIFHRVDLPQRRFTFTHYPPPPVLFFKEPILTHQGFGFSRSIFYWRHSYTKYSPHNSVHVILKVHITLIESLLSETLFLFIREDKRIWPFKYGLVRCDHFRLRYLLVKHHLS